MVYRFVFYASVLVSFCACQSLRHNAFENIQNGMTKADVIEIVGGPNHSRRWHGRDRWEYVMHATPEGIINREVHFENGLSVYAGAPILAAISAAEQDQINENYNRIAEQTEFTSSAGRHGEVEIQKFEPVTE